MTPLRIFLLSLATAVPAIVWGGPPHHDWHPERLQAYYWIARWPDADRVVLDAGAVAAGNARLMAEDTSVRDLTLGPLRLSGAVVERMVTARSKLPTGSLFIAGGREVLEADRQSWHNSLAIYTIPAEIEPSWGLVVHRAAVRRFPTATRVSTTSDDTDIDCFQESALFPGMPVAIVHTSRDGRWAYVLASNYDGWVADESIACGSREKVLDYASRPGRMITAAQARTVFTPAEPTLSQLLLDMGTLVPDEPDWPRDKGVNGQGSVAAHVLMLPVRDASGQLALRPALLPWAADSHPGPLPASRANLLRQVFKFVGERYGWGSDFEARDCSGLACDAYRSLGILLPRNSRDQAVSPAFERTGIGADWGRARRLAVLATTAPGDLLYVPGHVMMVVGHESGVPWIIHDTHEGRDSVADTGSRGMTNGVVVVPLIHSSRSNGPDAVEQLTAVQRVLPVPGPPAAP